MIRLVQLHHPREGRAIAVVEEPSLHRLAGFLSIYDIAAECIRSGNKMSEIVSSLVRTDSLNYDKIYSGGSLWKLLPCFDHPADASRCFVTGTGLTHQASAENRQSMHGSERADPLTDSMKMYLSGVEGGSPPAGMVGAAPEWFYKGIGRILRAHGQYLAIPNHADDGGDEAEIAGVYLNGPDGNPHRVGLAQGNEFSDHVLEGKNYLYLAASKLRQCALGPELVIGHDFEELHGQVRIERAGQAVWQSPIASGRQSMSHTLANLEHHHFKHESHRHPGDAHIHFFGADVFSFRDRLQLQDGDEMVVAFDGMGRPLRNPIHLDTSEPRCIVVNTL